jgi:hypothetical protein
MTTSFLADHNMVRLPHAPDLAPSDDYLFPTVKKPQDIEMVDKEGLFCRLQEFLNDIPIRELRNVFTACIKRLVDISKGDGSPIP